jgi:hypothetical protein
MNISDLRRYMQNYGLLALLQIYDPFFIGLTSSNYCNTPDGATDRVFIKPEQMSITKRIQFTQTQSTYRSKLQLLYQCNSAGA